MKRFLAMTMATMMAVVSTNMLLADTTKSGEVKIEYDDSKDIEFDTITVTAIDDNTFDFSLDPGKILHDYNSTTYNENDSVYFTKVVPASFKAKSGKTLYKKSLTEVQAAGWNAVVTAVSDGTPTVAAGFYVWTPDTVSTGTGYTSGKPGKEVELTAGNIKNWFDVDDDGKLSLRADYKAGTNVCDGKIYKYAYTAIAADGIKDSVLTPISDYVTLASGNQSIATYDNLYADNEGTKATAAEVDFTPESTESVGTTTPITVVNKSTKKKTVTATVTMSNTSGIDFKAASTGLDSDKTASMYIAVTNGTKTNSLAASEDGTSASAKYEANLDPATISATVYQTEEKNDVTGGYKYAKFNSPTTTYTNDTFYLTAEISGTDADAKKAWKAWAEAKKNKTEMPAINVVYNVADFVNETPVASNKITVSGGKVITVADSANATITGVTIGGTAATEDTDYEVDLTDGVKVTLKNTSTSDRTVVIKYTVGGNNYSATATVAGVVENSTIADVTIPSSGTTLEIPVTVGSLGGVPTNFITVNMYGDGKTVDLITKGGSWGATYDSANDKIVIGEDAASWIIANADTAKGGTLTVKFDKGDDATFEFK